MNKLLFMLGALLLVSSQAYAETATLTWNANTEADLAGYKVYRSTTSGVWGAPLATLGKVTTYAIALPVLPAATTYFVTLTAIDASGNESPKAAPVSKLVAAALVRPGTPVLTVTVLSPTSLIVRWLDVPDGAGGVAKLDIRSAVAPLSWGSASSTPCTASPCTITGLVPSTAYALQAVAYRPGTPNIFGALSAVVSATTGVIVPSPTPTYCITASTVSPTEITIKGVPCVN